MALNNFMSRYVLPAARQATGLKYPDGTKKLQQSPSGFYLPQPPLTTRGAPFQPPNSTVPPPTPNNTIPLPSVKTPSTGIKIQPPQVNYPQPRPEEFEVIADSVYQGGGSSGSSGSSKNPFEIGFPQYNPYKFSVPKTVEPPSVTATEEFQKAAAAIPNYLKAMGIQAPEDTRESAYKAAYSKLDQAINAAAPARFQGGLQESANLKQVRDVFVPAQAAIEDQYAKAQQQYARDVMGLGEAGMRNALLAAMQSQKLSTEAGLDNARLNLEAQRSQADEQRTAFDINRMTPWELRNMLAISGSDEYNRALRAMNLPENLYQAYKL